MRGVAVQGKDEDRTGGQPAEAARKRVAIELIRNHDRPLRWTARRYSMCPEDAEDAYQRGIEILLSKAPTDDPRQLLPWTRTVIKHEALAIRKVRERTMARPGRLADEDHLEEDWVQLIPSESDGPDDLTVRRERVARSREALGELKPAELKALTQLAEGFSYQEIGSMNDWTRTKVNRCLAEGRARFRSAFRESEAGERCPEFEPLISACCDGELAGPALASLENHLAACGHCRATLRAYRAAPKAAASLLPMIPAGRGFWERLQEMFVEGQTRLNGLGRGSDAGIQGVLASGGTRGAGMAAIAKLTAICAGTAGTAAVCAATGVLPTPAILDRSVEKKAADRPVKVAAEPRKRPMRFVEAEPAPAQPEPVQPSQPDQTQPEATVPEPVSESPVVTSSAPPPTSTETEISPEAAGTPVPASAPPPQPSSSAGPVGNGGGEFAP